MALTLNGVKNSLPSDLLPSGYSRPSVTTFTDYTWSDERTFTVLKSTVENATASTTMTNIIDNATIGLDKQVDDLIENDFDTTQTITAYADWTNVTTNYSVVNGSSDVFTNTACSYQCTVTIYLKVA